MAAAYSRGLLQRMRRAASCNFELRNADPPSHSSTHSTSQCYSSASAKLKMKMNKGKMGMPMPQAEPLTKRQKELVRILGLDKRQDDSLDPDVFLLKVLKKELKNAEQSIQKYKVAIKGSFYPFEVVPIQGTSNLILRRQLKDEEITIKCILELEEPDDEEYLMEDDEHELSILQHLKMNIEMRKACLGDGARFQLFCHYLTQSIKIEEIVYLDKSAYVENNYPYTGPFFGDLNPRMQQCFYDLIKDRGIDARLADLALDHLSIKYQEEYLNWVHNIRWFLKRRGS